MDLNTISITGNLTRDYEMRATTSGTSVLTLSVAVGRPSQRYFTDYFTIKVFGRYAESVKNYLLKGKKIGCTGELQTNKWTDKYGKEHTDVFIVAQNIVFLEKAKPAEKKEWDDLPIGEPIPDEELSQAFDDEEELPF